MCWKNESERVRERKRDGGKKAEELATDKYQPECEFSNMENDETEVRVFSMTNNKLHEYKL